MWEFPRGITVRRGAPVVPRGGRGFLIAVRPVSRECPQQHLVECRWQVGESARCRWILGQHLSHHPCQVALEQWSGGEQFVAPRSQLVGVGAVVGTAVDVVELLGRGVLRGDAVDVLEVIISPGCPELTTRSTRALRTLGPVFSSSRFVDPVAPSIRPDSHIPPHLIRSVASLGLPAVDLASLTRSSLARCRLAAFARPETLPLVASHCSGTLAGARHVARTGFMA